MKDPFIDTMQMFRFTDFRKWGIGLALVERILEREPNLTVCLASRNIAKAETVREDLLFKFPRAHIDVIVCDVSSIKSVKRCCDEIKLKYSHVDLLYLNAGVMHVAGVDWGVLFRSALSPKEFSYRLMTGNGLLKQNEGEPTMDGLQPTFATNVFGHHLMVKELLPVLGGEANSQVIWTSSSNASRQAFSLLDIQHKNGTEPYASSKYAIDLLSNAINTKYNSQGIYSHSTCPGLVMTNLTNGILPQWFWTLLLPLLMLLRLIAASLTISAFNGCEALLWLSEQRPERLDPKSKFYSRTSLMGVRYVTAKQMDIDCQDASHLFTSLQSLEESITT